MQLTDEQLETWKRDGSIVVPDVFPPESFAP
ncbi:proline hydroxylase, partial [Candidatus Poribacteria bacterium]